MVQAEPVNGRRTVTSIMNTLVADHGMTGISYPTVRGYVVSLRGSSQQQRPRPARYRGLERSRPPRREGLPP